jgi:predicted RNA-binding Zn-ribbon protein involved in translation (DUF1610 family)
MTVLDDIRDVFKSVKHHKPSKIYCPKCGAPDLHLSSTFDSWLIPEKYICDKCGYVGPVYMELEKEKE